MPIEFLCPSCSKQLRVPDAAAGKQAKCPSCDNICSIPAATSTAAANVATAHASTAESPPNPFSKPPQSDHLKETNYFPNQQAAAEHPAAVNPYAAPIGVANVGRPEHFKTASRGSRLGGKILDRVLAIVAGLLLGAALALLGGVLAQDEDAAGVGFGIGFAIGAIAWVIFNWVMITKSGQTVGKKMMSTKIVSESTGQVPDFVQGVLLRSIVFAILNQIVPFLFLVDICWIFGDNHQCLHDLLAKTRVVEA